MGVTENAFALATLPRLEQHLAADAASRFFGHAIPRKFRYITLSPQSPKTEMY
jgi:hypothetical protein